MISSFKGIIWDWNGTLLDDAELALQTMNGMLERRGMQTLSIAGYKSVFTFPVKEYYQKIGFDFQKEAFEIPANEFIVNYNSRLDTCRLHSDAVRVLDYFQSVGINQYIVSAMEQTVLDQCLLNYQIDHFFEQVIGLDNVYAASKIENGHRLIAEQQLDANELVLIGDTIHDFEVATELGCQCVLIANGHQSKEVLRSTGALVLDSISQLLG